jgi:hypothetical protein
MLHSSGRTFEKQLQWCAPRRRFTTVVFLLNTTRPVWDDVFLPHRSQSSCAYFDILNLSFSGTRIVQQSFPVPHRGRVRPPHEVLFDIATYV